MSPVASMNFIIQNIERKNLQRTYPVQQSVVPHDLHRSGLYLQQPHHPSLIHFIIVVSYISKDRKRHSHDKQLPKPQ